MVPSIAQAAGSGTLVLELEGRDVSSSATGISNTLR
jgi:hypothetical protein